jgi:hypothetical protein
MAGRKGRSGGRRPGAGAKRRAELERLHNLLDANVGDTVWTRLINALVKRALRGDVAAFRELRHMRFGHMPLATLPDPNQPVVPIQYIKVPAPDEPEPNN